MAEATMDHLAQDVERLRDSDRQLAVDIREITAGLASVRTEIRLLWRIGGGIAALFASVLLWTAGQTFGLASRVGELSAEVRGNAIQLEKRMDKLEARFDRLETKIDQRFAQIDEKLAVITQQIGKLVPKP